MYIPQKDSYIKGAPVLLTMCVSIQLHNLICNVGTCLLSCQRKEESLGDYLQEYESLSERFKDNLSFLEFCQLKEARSNT